MKEKLYYKIGEVARMASLKAYVLRYWETEFPFLAPQKTAKGQRIYRKQDVEMVLRVKELLHVQGFTIAGARRLLEEEIAKGPGGDAEAPAAPALLPPEPGGEAFRSLRESLDQTRQALRDILTILRRDA